MKRRAYSLTEVLIVIGIVCILATFLYPILKSAKSASRTASSTAAMRQLGQAREIYMSGFDDVFLADTIPLVRQNPELKKLLNHPGDLHPKGLANKIRGIVGHRDRITSYKDSYPVLADCVGPFYHFAFATVPNGGWLVDFTEGEYWVGTEETPLPIGRLRRLTFGGSVIVRSGTYFRAEASQPGGSAGLGVQPSSWFADQDPLPPRKKPGDE